MHFFQWSCSAAVSERTVVCSGRLQVEMWETVCWKWHPADLSITSDDMVIGEVGSGGLEHRGRPLGTEQRGGSYGTADALRHFKLSDGVPLISQKASVNNRKGSHVKKKPFQLQPLELQCRTHTCTNTHPKTHTHSHTEKYIWVWSESKGWIQWQPEWRKKRDIWHLHCSSAYTALTCNRVKAKHRPFG